MENPPLNVQTRDLIIPDRFHPLFSSIEADVILAAKDGALLFRIHSYTLKMTSGFFRTMYSLPQSSSNSSLDDVIYLEEDSHILECLLRMVCGLPLLNVETYAQVDSLLFAAEKYEMPGPMSILRLQVMAHPLVDEPFQLYATACRYGWKAEAEFASTLTLSYNIHDPSLRPLLQKLPTNAALDLFELHHSRRENLRERLNDPPFISGEPSLCLQCNTPINNHTWRELKYKIILEMDDRPLGDTVSQNGLNEWSEALTCWSSKCQCGRLLYAKKETVRAIREIIDGLVKSI